MQKYVYIIRPVGQRGPVKIGCSELPVRRLETYLAWSPVDLEIVAQIEGDFDIERRIHGAFKDSHKRGEWFDVTDALDAFIAGLMAGRPINELLDLSSPCVSFRKGPGTSEDGKRRMKYWMRMHWAFRRAPGYSWPDDVNEILRRWSGYAPYMGLERAPNAEEVARLETVIADPTRHGVLKQEAA